ncbi:MULTISPECIES: hypothetical protein [unclassified Streptomyces]|uniref:hypothetical protein n=1 Tax=unclassified Streptomyces TaxID=2593676 RepID=UPI0033B94FD1
MATTLTLDKRDGAFVLDGVGTPKASLEFGRGMRTGTITVAGKQLPVASSGKVRETVTVGAGTPVVRLSPDTSYVGNPAATAEWSFSRGFRDGYHATLTRGKHRLDFALPRMKGKSVEVTVTGSWDDLELVALTGCFALLASRRGDAYRTITVVGAIGPHAR